MADELIRIQDFNGPLDLLNYIIEERKADLFNLPIAEIADQYMHLLHHSEDTQINMELASEFLLMGATLLQIKTAMLLPEKVSESSEEGHDPRDELVLRLMAYRRMKILANELEAQLSARQKYYLKPPETPARLGIRGEWISDPPDLRKLEDAIKLLQERNALRLGEARRKMFHFIQRERFSVKNKVKEILNRLRREVRFFFNELFPIATCGKAERVSAFLAMLELIRENRISAFQEKPFGVILLEKSGPVRKTATEEHEHGQ